MGLNLAPSAISYLLFSILEVIFIIIPLIVFKIQKKDLKYEFRHRIIPNETLNRSKWFRLADIMTGILIGFFFYQIGHFITDITRKIIINKHGIEYYNTAVEGSVDTTPPPPPPETSSFEIYLILVIGIVVMFLFVALSEEFCFRGVLQKEFGHIKQFFGLIMSSFLFMIYHVFPGIVPWITFLSFWLYYLVFGILLGLITLYQKGDLIIPIVAHGTINSIIWINLYLPYL